MVQALYVHDGCSVDYTPGADVAVGDVVVQGELVGVMKRSITSGTAGAIAVEGVFDVAKATGASTAITAGAKLYWNATSKVATADDADGVNKYLGKCVRAAADADTTVRVRLCP